MIGPRVIVFGMTDQMTTFLSALLLVIGQCVIPSLSNLKKIPFSNEII